MPNKISIHIMAGLFLAMGMASAVGAQQDSRPSMSMDELLEYSIEGLKGRMQQVAQANNQLEMKNESLRKRILSFRQRLRELENQKIVLQEETAELTGMKNMDGQEASLSEKKLYDVWSYRQKLNEEQIRLQKLIHEQPDNLARLKEDVDRLKQDLQTPRTQGVDNKPVELKQQYDREKHKYLQIGQEAYRRIKLLKRNISSLEKRLEGPDRKYGQFMQSKQEVSKEKDLAQNEWQTEQRKEQVLLTNAKALERRKQQTLDRAKEEIFHLTEYRSQLADTIRALSDVQKDIASEIRTYQRETVMNKKFLDQENRFLLKKEGAVKEALGLVKEQKEKVEGNNALAATHNEYLAQTRDLELERENLRKQIDDQADQEEGLRQTEKDLRKNIPRLSRQARVTTQDTQSFHAQLLVDQKKAVSDAIKESERAAVRLQNDIARFNDESARLEKQKETLAQERAQWEDRVETEEKWLQTALVEEAMISDKSKNLEAQHHVASRPVIEEIQALRLRKEILANSLQTVQEKYDADTVATENFRAERRELGEYLAFLKNENQGLLQKFKDLQTEVDSLRQKQQQALKSSSR